MAEVMAVCASTHATAIWAMDIPAAAASGRSASTVRIVGDDAYALFSAEREQLALGLTEQQVVARLYRIEARKPKRLAATERPGHLVGVVVRAADVAGLARAHNVVERAQRLVHRRLRVWMMDLVEVDEIGAEPAERALDGVQDVLARGAAVPWLGAHGAGALGRDHEVVAPALEPPPENLLRAPHGLVGAAQRIDVGRVEKGDPARRCAIENGDRGGLVALQPERHRAETETRHLQSGAAEADVAHRAQRVAGMPTIGKWARLDGRSGAAEDR